jgi:hypothetical protein
MLSRRALQRALSHPDQAVDFVRRNVSGRVKNRLTGGYIRPSDKSVLDDDWDVLVILDACRYDMLAENNPFDEDVEKRISQGPNTAAWFEANFVSAPDERLEDIVYVATIPNASSKYIDPNRLAHLEEVFRYGWNDELRTTPPDVVTAAAVQLHRKYPSERLVVHYAQPHVPFVGHGDYRSELYMPDYVKYDGADVSADSETVKDIVAAPDVMNMYNHPFRSLKKGVATEAEVWEAYRANLEYVLPYVIELQKYVSGRVCVSADHGNGMGEHGIYGHPPWGFTKPVLEIPWVCTTGGGQEPPDHLIDTDIDKSEVDVSVEQQLEDLGYK